MRKLYEKAIKMYVESDKSFKEVVAIINSKAKNEDDKIYLENFDFDKEELVARHKIMPKVTNIQKEIYEQEIEEMMLDYMLVESFPETLKYLDKYIKKMNSITDKQVYDLVFNNKEVISYQRHGVITSHINKASSYYIKKKNKLVMLAFDLISDECNLNIAATADKYGFEDIEYFNNKYNTYLKENGMMFDKKQSIAVDLIELYLASNERIEDFCIDHKITISKFNTLVESIEKENRGMYHVIKEKLEMQQSQKNAFYKAKAKEINEMILNGVGRQQLSFNIVDYYTVSSINHEDFVKAIFNVRAPEAKNISDHLKVGNFAVKQFTTKYPNVVDGDLIESRKYKFDDIEITRDDIDFVTEMFDQYEIPKLTITYEAALRRLAKGQEVVPLKEGNYVKRLCKK